jgi:hypothetical protein
MFTAVVIVTVPYVRIFSVRVLIPADRRAAPAAVMPFGSAITAAHL